MAEVERETGRPLGRGTLYAAPARLERRGLIEAVPSEARRHPYRLTPLGSRALAEAQARLEALARRGGARIGRGEA